MRIPHGHIDIGRALAVEVIIEHLVGTHPAQLDAGLALDDDKALHLARVVVVAPGDTGHRGREAHLPPYPYLHRLDKTAAGIGVLHQLHREVLLHVDVAAEGVEQIPLVPVTERRDNALLEVEALELAEAVEHLAHLHGKVEGHFVAFDHHLGNLGLTADPLADVFAQRTHIDEMHLAVLHHHRLLAVGQLIGKRSDKRVVVGAAEGSEDIGYHQPGERGPLTAGPLLEQATPLALAATVLVAALLLRTRRKEHIGAHPGRLHRLDKLAHQLHVGLIQHLRIGVTVHCRQMHNDIALPHKRLQPFPVGKKGILERYPLEHFGPEPQRMVQMCTHETSLPGNSYSYHTPSYAFRFKSSRTRSSLSSNCFISSTSRRCVL